MGRNVKYVRLQSLFSSIAHLHLFHVGGPTAGTEISRWSPNNLLCTCVSAADILINVCSGLFDERQENYTVDIREQLYIQSHHITNN
jgi:hypothetical protein